MKLSRHARERADSNPASKGDRLLSIDQAAEALNVGPRFIRRLVYERRIDFVKIGNHVRIEQRALDAFIERGRRPAHPETPKGKRRP